MDIELTCPSCQRTLRVRPEYRGKSGTCKYCKYPIRVPNGELLPVAERVSDNRPPTVVDLDDPLEGRLAEIEDGLRRARQALTARTEDRDAANRELAATRAERDRLQVHVAELARQTGELQTQLEKVQERVGELLAAPVPEPATDPSVRDDLNRALSDLAESLEQRQSALADARALSREADDLRGQLADVRQDLEVAQGRIVELEYALGERTRQEDERLAQAHLKAQDEVRKLTAQLAGLTEARERMALRCMELESSEQRSRGEIAVLRRELDRSRHEEEEAGLRAEDLAGQLCVVREELQAVRTAIAAAEREREDARVESSTLRQELEGARRRGEAIRAKLDEARAELGAHESNRGALQAGFAAAAPEVASLVKQDTPDGIAEAAAAQAREATLSQQITELTGELAEARGAAANLRTELAQLRQARETERTTETRVETPPSADLLRQRDDLAAQVRVLRAELEHLREAEARRRDEAEAAHVAALLSAGEAVPGLPVDDEDNGDRDVQLEELNRLRYEVAVLRDAVAGMGMNISVH